jgi:hypothetical protein
MRTTRIPCQQDSAKIEDYILVLAGSHLSQLDQSGQKLREETLLRPAGARFA